MDCVIQHVLRGSDECMQRLIYMAPAIPPTALTAYQKYSQAMAVAADLANLASEVGTVGTVLRTPQHSPELTG